MVSSRVFYRIPQLNKDRSRRLITPPGEVIVVDDGSTDGSVYHFYNGVSFVMGSLRSAIHALKVRAAEPVKSSVPID
jgi:hypothetical protein